MEIKNPSLINARTRSPPQANQSMASGSSIDTFGSFEHLPPTYKLPTYSPPTKRSTVMDKWAALGNRRRAATVEKEDKPSRGQKATGAGGWRNGMRMFSGNIGMGSRKTSGSASAVWERAWGRDIPAASPGMGRVGDWRRDHFHGGQAYSLDKPIVEDDGDVEWIGGWQDFHMA